MKDLGPMKIGAEVVTIQAATAIAKAAKLFKISVAESVRDFKQVETWVNNEPRRVA